jgi:NodT family efflux transporter outer membrane factor (OMF) lipoprotein
MVASTRWQKSTASPLVRRRERLQSAFLGVLSLLLVSLLTGCMSISIPHPDLALPAQWPQDGAASKNNLPAPDLQHWWTAFADPVLGRIVQQALQDNLSLAEARERLRQARILLGHADDPFLPELHFHAQSAQSADALDTFFQYGLDATWELGLFGRQEGNERIAQAKLDSAASNADAIRVSVLAEVVRSYVELRTAQQEVLLQEKLQALSEQKARLLEMRSGLGLTAAHEAAAARADSDGEATTLIERQQDAGLAALRLALLTGRSQPDPAWQVTAAQPTLAHFSLGGIPADLLRTRPEIRSAEANVLDSAGELGVARAEMYPYIALGGTYLYSANLTKNFTFEGSFHGSPSFGPIVDVPLFDWGRRHTRAKAQQAALNAAVLAYRQAVMTGVVETESAMLQMQAQEKRVQQRQAALERLAPNSGRQQLLQQLGLSSPLQSVDESRQQLQAEIALLDANAGHDLAFIALYKALGGANPPGREDTHS